MMDLFEIAKNMAWPLTLLVAWLLGEFGFRWLKLPRMSTYAIVGFAVGAGQFGLLPSTPTHDILLLANIALGLILFEAGHRINMRWLISNPWMGISSVVESVLTFFVVFYLSTWFQLSTASSLLIASLSMATSPATIVRVVNEHRSSGQMTERLLHLSVLNCVLAVLTFKVIVGTEIFRTSGNLGHAIYSSLVVLFVSAHFGRDDGLDNAYHTEKNQKHKSRHHIGICHCGYFSGGINAFTKTIAYCCNHRFRIDFKT